MSSARSIVKTSAYAGGGVGLAAVAMFGVLRGEARMAKRRVLSHTGVQDPPDGTGYWGSGVGTALTLAMIGDSSAVGRGVHDVTQTPGVLLAVALSELADRPVRLVQVAVSGSESRDLDLQIGRALPEGPDIAVLMIGANDVTARVSPATAMNHLRRAVLALREADVEVVVGTCPDLGTLRPVPQPLRRFGRRWSRQMAAAQTVTVVEAGGRSVSLGSILGPEFAVRPELFSEDEFHPSATGYARAAAVMLPSLADALGLPAPSEVHALPAPGGVRPMTRTALRASRAVPVARAAARAATRPGTEVTAAPGRVRGRGRLLALSLRRGPAKMPTSAEMSEADHQQVHEEQAP